MAQVVRGDAHHYGIAWENTDVVPSQVSGELSEDGRSFFTLATDLNFVLASAFGVNNGTFKVQQIIFGQRVISFLRVVL